MITIPHRILQEDFVDVIYQGSDLIMLRKELDSPLHERPSFVSMHALSVVGQGTQRIQALDGDFVMIPTGNFGLVKKGLYTVTDLLADEQRFSSVHFFFGERLLEKLLQAAEKSTRSERPSSFFQASSPAYWPTFLQSLLDLRQSNLGKSPLLFEIKFMEWMAVLITTYPDLLATLHSWKTRPAPNLKSFMEQHFDKPLTVEDYAYMTGRSVATFRREFKSRFGTSPRKWIIRQRLEKARELLFKPETRVADVAGQVGYENTSHFILAYKKAYGHTPGQGKAMR
ncbi:MAG: AraC family transcriptional regulator [Bacteroidota bacterium]